MRCEKPPMPAPPEYTRESLYEIKKQSKQQQTGLASQDMSSSALLSGGDESVLNELRSMLSRDLDTVVATNQSGVGDCFGDVDGLLNKSSPSSSASPAVLDSDDNVHLLANHNNQYYHHQQRLSFSSGAQSQAQSTKQTSLMNSTRQNLVNEIFMANARLKQQLSQIADIDLSNKHQLQKLLP